MAHMRYGGSFAPPLNQQKLDRFKQLASDAGAQTGEYMTTLIAMVEKFLETGASSSPGKPHPSGVGRIIPLDDAEKTRIWDSVPWREELEMMSAVFDQLPKGETRNAAFHLLWYGRELNSDREPITNDNL